MAEKIEGRPLIEERIAELKAEGKTEDRITLILYEEGYPTEEVLKHGFKKREEPAKEVPEERIPFEERVKELEASGIPKKEVCRTLILEDYNPRLLVTKFGGLYAKVMREIKSERVKEDTSFMATVAGTTRGPGYLDEFKDMIRHQIGRSRELTEIFYNIGMGTLLASLSKSGMSMDAFRAIALKQTGLKEALEQAGATAFKALEYYQSNLITTVEKERDEARAYSTVLKTQVEELLKNMDPKFRLERMIQAYLLSGGVDANILMTLIDKWLAIEWEEIRIEGLEVVR